MIFKVREIVSRGAAAVAMAGSLLAPHSARAADPFIWGDKTHVADAGWARMIPLRGGDWLCVDNLYPKPNSILQLELSSDKGRSWKPLGTVSEPGRNLDNGSLIQLPNGDILLTGRSVVEHHTPGSVMSFHLPVYRSKDGGKSWTFISQVDTSEPPPYVAGRPSQGLWEPHFYLLDDGRLACAYADEKHSLDKPAYSQIVGQRISDDGGVTWGEEIVVAAQIGGGAQRPGMPIITRMKNGRYIAVYEVVGIGNADVYCKTSPDGIAWPEGIGQPVPGQHAGPWVTSLRDGRLVVTSCENRISYSTDYGVTWQLTEAQAVPLKFVFTWPAIYQTADDEIGVMTTKDGVNIRWGKILP